MHAVQFHPEAEAHVIRDLLDARELEGAIQSTDHGRKIRELDSSCGQDALMISETIASPIGPLVLVEAQGVLVTLAFEHRWSVALKHLKRHWGLVDCSRVCLAKTPVQAFFQGDKSALGAWIGADQEPCFSVRFGGRLRQSRGAKPEVTLKSRTPWGGPIRCVLSPMRSDRTP